MRPTLDPALVLCLWLAAFCAVWMAHLAAGVTAGSPFYPAAIATAWAVGVLTHRLCERNDRP